MAIRYTHGRPRVEGARTDELPPVPAAPTGSAPDPDRDPTTKRFTPGNQAGRRRAARRAEKASQAAEARVKKLFGARTEELHKVMRPAATRAPDVVVALISQLPTQSAALNLLCEHTAVADAMTRAFTHLAGLGALKFASEARSWSREFRLNAIALADLSSRGDPDRGDGPRALPPWLVAPEEGPQATRDNHDATTDDTPSGAALLADIDEGDPRP